MAKNMKVKVKGQKDNRIGLSWSFSSAVKNFLDNELVVNEDYYWVPGAKDAFGKVTEWICWINYPILQEVLDVLSDNHYDISEVEATPLPQSSEEIVKNKVLTIEDIYPGAYPVDGCVYLSWENDRAINSLVKAIPKSLGCWTPPDASGKFRYRIRNFMLKDILPLFEDEGYDISEHAELIEDLDCEPDESLLEDYNNWLAQIEQSQKDKHRRANIADILGDEDMAGLEQGEYEMIDLSKKKLPFKPYDYQIEDIKTLLKHKRYLNANEMGTGKTMESVVVGESIPGKKLVVCPASLRLNWRKEIKNINKRAKVDILYSADDYHAGKDWTIIGYPSLEKHQEELIKEGFKVVFFDEAHFIQAVTHGRQTSKRAKASVELAKNIEYVYPITGTPKTNRNKNLYNILKLLKHPLTQGKNSYEAYADRYCGGCYARGKEENKNSHDRELNKRITPWMIRRLRKDVLPDLTKQRIIIDAEVNLSEYEEAMKQYREIAKDPTLTGRQRYSGSIGQLQRARVALAREKAPTSISMAQDIIDSEQSVVIITCFTCVVEAVEKKFKNKCVKIVGGMSDKAKQESIDRFQSGEVPVMVMNVIAGGVGVTLTKAHIAIVNDYDFTIGNMVQAEDRICRVGQSEHCLIYYISAIGSMLDEGFMGMLTQKSQSINAVIDGGRGETVHFIDMLNEKLGIEVPKDDLTQDEIEQIMNETLKEE